MATSIVVKLVQKGDREDVFINEDHSRIVSMLETLVNEKSVVLQVGVVLESIEQQDRLTVESVSFKEVTGGRLIDPSPIFLVYTVEVS